MTRIRLPIVLRSFLAAVGAFLVGAALEARAQDSPAAPSIIREAGPVTASRERQFDLTSGINGLVYRLMVSAPLNAAPDRVYPVLYVLDGNWYFRAASDTATWGSGRMPPAIVVGIGYPTEDNREVARRRTLDMTLSAHLPDYPPDSHGGGDAFLRVIEEEVKPFIAARYQVDASRQMIYGKSSGGLIVLRSLFRNPTAFSTYIVASPWISFNDREVLSDEASFSARARTGELNLKLLLTSAGEEQYRGTDTQRLDKMRIGGGMVDNVSELAARLTPLNPQHVRVSRAIFPEEGHASVSLASIGRAVRFALEPAPEEP